jgi:uncharacterized protein (DUF305 family)
MRRSRTTLAAALAATLAAATGCAAQATSTPPPADAAAMARARADSLRRPWTEADVRFMTNMIGHHAQAIVMANLVATHTTTPAMKILAGRIINAQRDEIATMQTWLRDRGRPVPEVGPAGTTTHTAGHEHHAMMPGMLSAEQMQELERARGTEFDRLFLRYMIQHHNGAVQMVSELFSSYGAGQDETVFKFASDVNVDQITEIARMQRMLVDLLFGESSP